MLNSEKGVKRMNQKLEELNEYLKKSKVAIIGLGVSNIPLLEYMHALNANVTVFDNKEMEQLPKDVVEKLKAFEFNGFFGKNSLDELNSFDIIFRSPSCLPTNPALCREAQRGAIITSEIEMLMKLCPGKIIGVTGSDGKTTTTTLIYEILKANGYHCYLGGNIGTPLFTQLGEMKEEDVVVLELSSFQLMGMEISPDVAVITNITPNHLNVHSSYEEYIDAKKNIFKHQNGTGLVVLNYDNDITRECAKEAEGKVIFYSGKTKLEDGYILDGTIIKECKDKLRKHLADTGKFKLRGRHMYEDACAAIAATSPFVEPEEAVKVVEKFEGVEHRLEFIRELNGVKWYNDSVASSPTRTIAGLYAYEEKITLIAGGKDKNLDYQPIGAPILEKVENLILVGETSEKIMDAVKAEEEKQGKQIKIYFCDNYPDAVATARKVTKPGEVVLLSPASTSFDLFKNFAERGEVFKKLVNEL